jgi:hypothetical protein
MERLPTEDIQPRDESSEGDEMLPPLVAAFRRHYGSMKGSIRLLEGDWTDPTGEDWGYGDT